MYMCMDFQHSGSQCSRTEFSINVSLHVQGPTVKH